MPGAVVVGVGAGAVPDVEGEGACIIWGVPPTCPFGDMDILGVMGAGAGAGVGVAGAEFRGAPTAISQRCPGSP